MADLSLFASLPEVRSSVLGDLGGSFLDAQNESDGESIAAVMGFLASTMNQVGEQIGLGAVRRLSVSTDKTGLVVVVDGESVMTLSVDAPKALAAVERLIDSTLQAED
jgi:predicted regulator of Ras-like GTPase activity (Roadblock/LC7/MglB family)